MPSDVGELVDHYLGTADRLAPGLVDGLHLTGSVALGDYHPGTSDIDFLAAVPSIDVALLASVHAEMPTSPNFDGIYLTPAQLAARPDDEPVVPHVVNGVFHTDKHCGELNPVLWLTLARYGVTVRGPSLRGLQVDEDRLRQWNLNNLTSYWQPLADQIRAVCADRRPDAPAAAVGVVWAALGPARLHYTLATGDVTSKGGAALYITERFPAWADLAARVVAWRAGEPVEFTTSDALAAADLVDAVTTDAAELGD